MAVKKTIISVICLLILILLSCGKAPVAETVSPVSSSSSETVVGTDPDIPVETPAPEADPEEYDDDQPESGRILGHCISILDAVPYAVDLNDDGAMETVDIMTYNGTDGCPRWAVSVKSGTTETVLKTDVPGDMPCDLWVGDLDEDGTYELFFHGDLASYDYVIYAWRGDLSPIPFEPDDRYAHWNEGDDPFIFAGYVDGFEDGHIVIEGTVDMLGTHFGIRNYSISEEGVIGPVSTVWQFDETDQPLTAARELTAYKAGVRKDPGEAFTLAAGDRFFPLASDGMERMWFETGDGRHGVLLLTPDPETMWRLDGIPEAECFESLPYSG